VRTVRQHGQHPRRGLGPGLVTSERSPKKGLVIPSWPRHHCYDFGAFTTVSWWYNYHTYQDPNDISPWWCTYPAGGRPEGEDRKNCFPNNPEEIQFVPQFYGINGYGRWGNVTDPDPGPEYPIILGYNEPNQADQADIPPDVAAAAWIDHQERFPDRVLVAPAVGHADTEWFDAFMEVCEVLGCRIDYLATHYYTDPPQQLMVRLKNFSDRYGGRKIWLTEFAVNKEHDEAKIVTFIQELLPLLEHADFIHRYSWFITRYYMEYDDSDPWFWLDPINSLLEQDHPRKTEVGKAYDHPWHLERYRPNITLW
jgi:hypothetical protein